MKRKIKLVVLIISWLGLIFFIQPSQATNTIVNVGVTYDDPSQSQSVYLEADNYTITITSDGDIVENSGMTKWSLKKDSMILLTYTSELDYQSKTYRLTIHETANYTLEFDLYPNQFNPDAFMNYEVIITELDLVIHPKTSLISEAPYGMLFIVVGIVCYSLYHKKHRD